MRYQHDIDNGLLSVRTAITIISCVLLTLFWIIPVTAIMGLANLRALADITIRGDQPFSFLDNVSNWSPVVTGLIESLLPAIILSVFLGLVPTFLRMFVSVSRVGSLGNLDNTVRDWYFNFVTFSNFLFVALAGTLLNDLQQIISDPSSTIDLLATAVPKQAGFVMNFILLKALSETPQQILQIGRVAVRWIMLKFLARTARERRNVETGNTIFVYLRYYAMAQLIALLGLIYSTVQPFVIIVCFAYFAINYVVWKYNLCYSMNNPYHDGGSMYGGALYGVWVGLFVHLLTIMGLFGLNKKPAQCAISVIPLVFSILFIRKCKKRYARLLNHGSGVHTIQHIQQEDSEDLIPTSLAKTYGHPGFEPLPETIENLNGMGLNTGAVRFSDADDFDDTLVRIENGEEPAGESPRPSAQSESEDWKDAILLDKNHPNQFCSFR
ncbi:unnamed protein product [Chondrus crispus]|uniref:CSC1/OSCA1-like 7TM region domain-containing protein n=1 Tax=Chondrus crispus TaxID=2769 RepID=R7QLT8_CHOCR|nr:unnamed protein product [Chondrus crispus]CDF38436.1 unnamed protein product [Chondrus crispus]|eukprot:XP_005718329.1 unnamed protein product [Chondrus crispus]